jgi:hypothetical protein
VKFEDGAVANGYVIYDVATQKITNWNVRVSEGSGVPGFTYVPGNSEARTWPSGSGFSLIASGDVVLFRYLDTSLSAPLNGDSAVSISNGTAETYYYGVWDFDRALIAGSRVLSSSPPAVATVQVDEFYNEVLRHYFITAEAAEKRDLDNGVHRGWVRTGESFTAYATGSCAGGPINPVCRYYGDPLRGPRFPLLCSRR